MLTFLVIEVIATFAGPNCKSFCFEKKFSIFRLNIVFVKFNCKNIKTYQHFNKIKITEIRKIPNKIVKCKNFKINTEHRGKFHGCDRCTMERVVFR